jgi:hypothetical protein
LRNRFRNNYGRLQRTVNRTSVSTLLRFAQPIDGDRVAV